MMKRDRYDGLGEQHGHKDIVEASCDDGVGRGEFGEQVLNRGDRALGDALLVIASQPRLEDGSELVDHGRVTTIAEQQPDVVVVLEKPCRENGERLQISRVRLSTWLSCAVPSVILHQPETDDASRAFRSTLVARQ